MSDFLYSGSANSYATSRRGGLTNEDKRQIEAERAKARPTPWRVLADRYGRCESDIRALFNPTPANDAAPAQAPAVPIMSYEVRRRAERLSRQDPFWDEEKDRFLQTLFLDRQMSKRECAVVLGTGLKAVEGRLERLGIRARDRLKQRAA